MPIGPGRYDAELGAALDSIRKRTEGRAWGGLLIVAGEPGFTGFSAHLTAMELAAVPSVLRQVADDIERDAKEGRLLQEGTPCAMCQKTISSDASPDPSPAERAFYRFLIEQPLHTRTPEFIGGAISGFTVRQHFDEHHPGQLAVAEQMAPKEGAPNREGWLAGFRFEAPKP